MRKNYLVILCHGHIVDQILSEKSNFHVWTFILGCLLFKIPQGDFSKPRNLNVTSDLPKISGGTQF